VIGTDVYRGSDYADLDGIYFAGDFCSGRVWGLERDDSGQWQMQELLDTKLFMTGSGTGDNGDLYITSCVCGYGTQSQPDGAVWRVVSANNVPQGAETAEVETAAGATPAAAQESEMEVTGATPAAGGTPASS
jgi:hypothetical protein